jgi:hypothetical protein
MGAWLAGFGVSVGFRGMDSIVGTVDHYKNGLTVQGVCGAQSPNYTWAVAFSDFACATVEVENSKVSILVLLNSA